MYNTSLRSIVHIKRISCPSSPTFNVQPSPLSNAGYRRRLTFHGRYSTTQLLFPLEFIPPSLAPLLRSYSKFREIERGWKEEKEREKKLETRRKGGGRAWLEATIGIEIRCMGAGRRGGRAKRSFYSCLYAAPLKYRLCNWRAPYPGEDISTALNVCARTPSNAPQCALPQDFHPCQTYATSVFSIYGSTLSLLLFFFPSPPFSLVEIVSSFSFPRFRFRFLQQTTRKNENRSNWRLKMLEKEKISTR